MAIVKGESRREGRRGKEGTKRHAGLDIRTRLSAQLRKGGLCRNLLKSGVHLLVYDNGGLTLRGYQHICIDGKQARTLHKPLHINGRGGRCCIKGTRPHPTWSVT